MVHLDRIATGTSLNFGCQYNKNISASCVVNWICF